VGSGAEWAHGRPALLFNDGMNTLAVLSALLALSSASLDTTRLVDLDADGRLDLLRLTRGELRVDWNLGQRAFLPAELELPPIPVSSFLVEDLNADGRLDLYLVTSGANVALVSDGARGFIDATAALGLSDADAGLDVRSVDVDGDGFPDLVLRNEAGDVVFWGRRRGGFERDASLSTPSTRGSGSSQSAAVPGWTITPGALPPPLPGAFPAALGTHLPPGSLILWEDDSPPSGFELTSWSVRSDPPAAWFPDLAMPTARADAVAGVIEGKVHVMGGITSTGITDAVEAYTTFPSWKTGAKLPVPLRGASSAVVADRMYVIGGLTPGGATDDVNVLDPASGWAPRAPVPSQQFDPGCAALGDKIYLFGGSTAGSYLDLIREYDTLADSWKTLPSALSAPRAGSAATSLGGKIYVIGGIGSSGPVDTVDVFDPAAGTFSSAAPLPDPAGGGSAVTLDGRVFHLLGSTLHSYDPASNIWTQEASAASLHLDGTASVLNGRIHLVGGSDGTAFTGTHEVYDPGGPRLRVVRKK